MLQIKSYPRKPIYRSNVDSKITFLLFLFRGKAGWPKHLACFDGAAMYGEGWCDFGCAVSDLDPTNKFAGESWVWQWNATRGGQPAEFSSCCTPEGFNKAECVCSSSKSCITGAQQSVSEASGVSKPAADG